MAQRRSKAVADPLIARVPEDEADRRSDRAANGTWLLANLLGWHRREEKPDWWRYFHQLNDMTDEERLEANEPLAMLELVEQVAEDDKGRTFRYRFPEQDHDVSRTGTDPETKQSLVIESIDGERNQIVLRFPKGRELIHPAVARVHQRRPRESAGEAPPGHRALGPRERHRRRRALSRRA